MDKVDSVVTKLGELWDIVSKEDFNKKANPTKWWRVLGLIDSDMPVNKHLIKDLSTFREVMRLHSGHLHMSSPPCLT